MDTFYENEQIDDAGQSMHLHLLGLSLRPFVGIVSPILGPFLRS